MPPAQRKYNTTNNLSQHGQSYIRTGLYVNVDAVSCAQVIIILPFAAVPASRQRRSSPGCQAEELAVPRPGTRRLPRMRLLGRLVRHPVHVCRSLVTRRRGPARTVRLSGVRPTRVVPTQIGTA